MSASASITSAMVFGYDTVVNGASISMPAFLLYFGSMGPTGPYLPSIWTSLGRPLEATRADSDWLGSLRHLRTRLGIGCSTDPLSSGPLVRLLYLHGLGIKLSFRLTSTRLYL